MDKILKFLAFVAYIAISYRSFRLSSEPSEPCVGLNPDECVRPLFPFSATSGEDLLESFILQLFIQEESEASEPLTTESKKRKTKNPRLDWTLLTNCQLSFNISSDDVDAMYQKRKFGGKGDNCTLEFQNFTRARLDSAHKDSNEAYRPSTLKAMFILKRRHLHYPSEHAHMEHHEIIAKTVFDLTRLVELEKNSQIPHFKYNRQPVVLRLIADQQLYPEHMPIRGDGLRLTYMRQGKQTYHRPIMYVDDVALKYSSQIQLASPEDQMKNPRPPVTLNVQFSVISTFRHVFHRQLELGFSMLENVLEPNELDELRHMISDEYIYRFILTQIITMVHVYVDYMAFRDEIGFYRGKKSMGGISMSSVIGRFISQFIIFLYLCDGNSTSWLILGSIGSGVMIEFWKITKFIRFKITKDFPFISLHYTSNMTTLEKDTINYDGIAHTYLGLILYPLVFGSALYSKKFHVYSSLWSWIISNLANAVYTFGFITLCPQLYVNYRLKSVAHLPWKVFIYKIFNTFVDDVFAFLIQMPLKHKLMTLRDDVVFFVFIIQAYIYRVDKARTNEYGYAYEEGDEGNKNVVEHHDQDDASSIPNDKDEGHAKID